MKVFNVEDIGEKGLDYLLGDELEKTSRKLKNIQTTFRLVEFEGWATANSLTWQSCELKKPKIISVINTILNRSPELSGARSSWQTKGGKAYF